MANLVSSFCNYYHINPDLYQAATNFYTPFRADPAVLLATIINSLESCTWCLSHRIIDGKHESLTISGSLTILACGLARHRHCSQ